MTSRNERRAAAFEAIARALLELAAVEREPDERPAQETLIDRRNSASELGLTAHAFTHAAGREFPAFRVSRRLTATKADVLAWLKTRRVAPKPPRAHQGDTKPPDPDSFLRLVDAKFRARVGRPMTDQELDDADLWIDAGRSFHAEFGREFADTPDQVAARIQSAIAEEPGRHGHWRALGLDPGAMERDAENLRERLHREYPEWTWRDRQQKVSEMWDAISEPLSEARRADRAAARATKKAAKASAARLGSKR